jgi:hypothetical protein
MILRDETVKREFVVELRSELVFPHHRLLPPLWGLDSPFQSYHASQVLSSSATIPAKMRHF